MFSAGRNAALSAYGLKTAGWLEGARELAVGKPGTWDAIKSQASTGGLTAPGGAYHNPLGWLIPRADPAHQGPGTWNKIKSVGSFAASALQPLMMAHAGYQALKAPPEYRGEAVGSLLGSLAGGTLGAPFGMAGNLVGSTLGQLGGGFLGKHIGNAVSPPQESFASPQ